ncbi:unnamed protein product [Amoebophrya sp. A25]|nr:unnamed protein product [Amoebophrya sp. A25]|eukprot:GSA25T00015025001.1
MAEVFAIHSPRSGQSSKEAPVSHEEEGRPATPSGESAETANKSSSTSANTSKNQNDNPTDSTSPMKSPEKQSQSPEMKQSSKKLSFREHLSGEADFLLQRNSSRRALEDFANLLDSLATIEETYASSLQKLVQADHARADISPLDDAYDSVRSMLANRADQGSILADQIRSDVVAMLRGMLGQHAAVHQSVSVDAQRVSRLNGAKRHNYELLKQKYKETSLTAERMLVAAYSGGHSSSASASKSSSSSTSWGSLFPTNGTGSPDPEATTTSPTSRSPTSPTQESTTNAPTTRTSASATPVPGLGRTSTSATASATPVVTVSGLGSSEPSSPPKDAGSPKTGNLLGPGNLLGQKILSNIGLPTTAASASSSSSRPVNYRQEKENQHQGETSLVTSRGKLFDAVKRAYIFEDEFRRVSLEAREAEEVYRAQMAAILDALQDMEEKKLQCFRDASMRLLVYNTSCIRNVQYDIEGIFKSCEDVDSVKDVQNFIRSRVVSPSVEQEGGTKTAVSAWQRLIANDQPLPRFVRYREMVPPLSNDPSSRAPGSASSRLPRRPIDQICGEVQRLRDCIATQWFENGDFSLLRNQEFFAALREEPEFRARIFACIRQQMVNKQCAVWEIGDDHESSLKTKQDEPGQSEYGAVLHHADDVLVEAKNSGTDAGLLSNSSLVLRLFTEIPDLIRASGTWKQRSISLRLVDVLKSLLKGHLRVHLLV